MIAKIEIKPLSVNNAFKGRKYKTKAYQSYEKDLMLNLPKTKDFFKTDDMLRIEFTFGFSSFASDIDNPVKPTLDILCKKYGFDDKQIWELEISKKIVAKGHEYVAFQITKIPPF